MNKKIFYTSPLLQEVEIKLEKGFAESDDIMCAGEYQIDEWGE